MNRARIAGSMVAPVYVPTLPASDIRASPAAAARFRPSGSGPYAASTSPTRATITTSAPTPTGAVGSGAVVGSEGSVGSAGRRAVSPRINSTTASARHCPTVRVSRTTTTCPSSPTAVPAGRGFATRSTAALIRAPFTGSTTGRSIVTPAKSLEMAQVERS